MASILACLANHLLRLNRRSSPVAPGSKLFIFTDGITEARNAGGELYGTQRITETVRRLAAANASGACDQLLEDLAVFCGNTPAEDDLTLLVIEV